MGVWRQNYQTQGAGLHPAEQSARKATVTTHPDALFINGLLPAHPPKKMPPRPAQQGRGGTPKIPRNPEAPSRITATVKRYFAGRP